MEYQIRQDTPQVGSAPYRQIHMHSTGNSRSTAQNEADYMNRKNLETGFFTHVVGNGRVIQVAPTNRGAWDVGGGWNYETYGALELIESHTNYEDFYHDYCLWINLARDLADEAGIPKVLDSGDLAGIKTHYFCTNNQPYNRSDHTDPIYYLKKWGISYEQFKQDIANGVGTPQPQQEPQVGLKSVDEVAQEVLNGRWGNGDERRQNLQGAGYDYDDVQRAVNRLLGKEDQPQAFYKEWDEDGTMTVTVDSINVRNEPNTDGPVQAVYSRGEQVHYDKVVITHGYIWISYISYSGQRRYLATGEHDGHHRVGQAWGTFV